MNLPNNQFFKPPSKSIPKKQNKFLNIIVGVITGLFTLIALIWINFPVRYITNDIISSYYTETPIPPTLTPQLALTNIATKTPTLTPVIEATQLPTSAYAITIKESIDPVIPELVTDAIILNDDVNVEVSPEFSNIQWTHSSSIAQQLNLEFEEHFFATFGPATATWKMDVPVDTGLYEIYVLDTLYSSGGKLTFQVFIDDRRIEPLLGSPEIEYRSRSTDPQQRSDIWQSIGIYQLDSNGLVSVSTGWELRNEATIVAIDRLLIGRIPDTINTILSLLPSNQQRFLLDDSFADFDTTQYWEILDQSLAWGDKYHLMDNPPILTKVIWTIPYAIPVGKYEVMVWVPKIRGTANVVYSVTANNTNDLQNEEGQYEVTISQGDRQEPQWVSIGTWTVPEVYGELVYLKLNMTISSDSGGEVVADVIAFVKAP